MHSLEAAKQLKDICCENFGNGCYVLQKPVRVS